MEIIVAEKYFERLKGLLGKKSIPQNTGLLIRPCRQVHTYFMKFTIDVVFIDKQNKIIHMETLKPFKVSKYVWKAKAVIEFPEGTIAEKQFKIGDLLPFF